MSTSTSTRPLPEFLHPLQENLLIQCHPPEALRAAEIADRDNSGLVVTAKLGSWKPETARTEAYKVARHLRQTKGYQRPVLLDAARYSGSNRTAAVSRFNAGWIRRQRELGLPVLTDSGYVSEGDLAGLDSILRQAADLADAIALLPLNNSWLRNRKQLDLLTDKIRNAGVPVALILEHTGDPFELVGVVAAFLQIVKAGPPVLLLRCDVSALGALCVGAVAAAVGTSTGLRHLYPQTTGGGGGHDPLIAAVIKECLSYISLDKIALAAQREPEDTLWQCDCEACHRAPIRELAIHSPQRQAELAFVHSLDTLLELRDKILTPGSTLAQRTECWRQSCFNAQYRHMSVEDLTEKSPPPVFLGRWLHALATTSLQQRVR